MTMSVRESDRRPSAVDVNGAAESEVAVDVNGAAEVEVVFMPTPESSACGRPPRFGFLLPAGDEAGMGMRLDLGAPASAPSSSASLSLDVSASLPLALDARDELSFRFLGGLAVLTTSLKRAKRRISSATEASSSVTVFERRALAWAVDSRIRVSNVRAVKGEVCQAVNSRSSIASQDAPSSGSYPDRRSEAPSRPSQCARPHPPSGQA
jgi:hypothetical protein